MKDHVEEEALNSDLPPNLGVVRKKGIYDLKDHVEEKLLNSNLPPNLRVVKKNPPTKNRLNQTHISLCLFAPPRRGKIKHHWGNKKSAKW